MKGDFSAWRLTAKDDHQAVLFQQGRLISDADLTEAEMIALEWRVGAARDIIGAGVAAVPAGEPNGFAITRARVMGQAVELTLRPGRIWADGIPLTLHGPGNTTRLAGYFPHPINSIGTGIGTIGDGTRDAVVLEVELEDRSGFQNPDRLIEPALGGPDTAGRVAPRLTLGLVRLGANENCHNIGPRLQNDLGQQGRLSVSLAPPLAIPGDCPVFEGGGYSGFEHNLYRIEIAETRDGAARFKWSMWNGGLVGRGFFSGGAQPKVTITANRAAILHCGQTSFYLEALTFEDGRWSVSYGATAQMTQDGEIELAGQTAFGALPGNANPVFFRLWNGLRDVADFTNGANPMELRDGIRLAFAGLANHRPGHWWSFEVRAGEIVNPQVLLNNAPPEGPVLHRVALAEIEWTALRDTNLGGMIEDCRRRFRPLTNQKLCCTYVIGNGIDSFGDFNSLEEAAAHLPSEGGKLCLLPGQHFANLVINPGKEIEITGCQRRTQVLPRQASPTDPVISIRAGSALRVTDLDIIAPFSTAVLAEGAIQDLTIAGCRILGLTHAVKADGIEGLAIVDCDLWVVDDAKALSTLNLRAKSARVEKNRFGIWPRDLIPDDGNAQDNDNPGNPADPCFEPDDVYDNILIIIGIIVGLWNGTISAFPKQPYRAVGGIHVRGGARDIVIRSNRIEGGLGHGIALGGKAPGEPVKEAEEDTAPGKVFKAKVEKAFLAKTIDEQGNPLPQTEITISKARRSNESVAYVSDDGGDIEAAPDPADYILSTSPGLKIVDIKLEDGPDGLPLYIIMLAKDESSRNLDYAFLTTLLIEDNDIQRMGLSGIGFWFLDRFPEPIPPIDSFDLDAVVEVISALMAPAEIVLLTNITRALTIRGNRIEGNVQAVFTDILRKVALSIAMGGITLAQVEGLTIDGNRIVDNAPDASVPVAGIYVGYAEEAIISGNYIAGNGPLNARYTTDRMEGLRSGILIRLASSVLARATEDGQHKPALILRDNVVDQPAGRALTALAYGPVLCVGNSFNSEREGAWNIIDGMIGSVLLFNLGGLHRLVQFAKAEPRGFRQMEAVEESDYAAWRKDVRVEAMMPSGETLFNANRVRCGSENASWCSTLIATADDLGFDGNQLSAFRPEALFANLVAAGHSLRVTDSRFRERARAVAYSALTFTGGTTVNAGDLSMNQTSQNQGDHCIVAMTQGSMPVIERDNQVVMGVRCPVDEGVEQKEKSRYFVQSLMSLMAMMQFGGKLAGGNYVGKIAVPYQSVVQMQAQRMSMQARALVAEDLPVAETMKEKARLDLRKAHVQVLKTQTEIMSIREEPRPIEGIMLDGRVVDRLGQGLSGQKVEILDARGQSTGLSVMTDATGYYALPLDVATTEKLKMERGLSLRAGEVTDMRSPLDLSTDETRLRKELLLNGVKRPGSIFDRFDTTLLRPVPVDPVKKPSGPDVTLETMAELNDDERKLLRERGVVTLMDLRKFATDPKALQEIIPNRRRLSSLLKALKEPNG